MGKLASLYIKCGEPEGPLTGCPCEVGDWAADEIERLQQALQKSAAGPWNYDLSQAPDNVDLLIIMRNEQAHKEFRTVLNKRKAIQHQQPNAYTFIAFAEINLPEKEKEHDAQK